MNGDALKKGRNIKIRRNFSFVCPSLKEFTKKRASRMLKREISKTNMLTLLFLCKGIRDQPSKKPTIFDTFTKEYP